MDAACHTVDLLRKNRPLAHKKPGRWSRNAGGRRSQCSFCMKLFLHEKVVIGSGWSLFRVVAEAEFYCMVFASDQGWRWRCLASKDCEVLTGVAADGQSLSQHRFAVDCFRFPLFFICSFRCAFVFFCYLSLLLQSSSNRTWVAFKGTKSK